MRSNRSVMFSSRARFFTSPKKLSDHFRMRLALPVKNTFARLPFGYQVSEDDPDVLVADPEWVKEMLYLQEVKDDYSYKELSKYIKAKLGYQISRKGFTNVIEHRPLFKEAALPLEERERILTEMH